MKALDGWVFIFTRPQQQSLLDAGNCLISFGVHTTVFPLQYAAVLRELTKGLWMYYTHVSTSGNELVKAKSCFFFFNKIMTEIYGRKKRKCILECSVNQNAWLTKMFGLNSLPQVENCIKNVSHVFCSRERSRVAALLLRGFGGLPWLSFFWSSSAWEARSPSTLIQ